MSHAKQVSTKRKRSINAVPVLSAAGLSLSLASGASTAIGGPADMPTPKTGMSHEITLCEEEISDVSLATFYVFDNENAGTFRRRTSPSMIRSLSSGDVFHRAQCRPPRACLLSILRRSRDDARRRGCYHAVVRFIEVQEEVRGLYC